MEGILVKIKKVFSSLMALGLATTLAACGGNTDSANTEKDNADQATTEDTAENAEETTDDASEDNAEETTDNEDENTEEDAEASEEVENFEAQTSDDTLVLGLADLNGDFYGGWTNNTNDVTVRKLLGIEGNNGYATVIQDENGQWVNNPTVLDGEPKVTENEDGSKTYQYKIKEDLKWSDGEPITADDYLYGSLIFTHPSYTPVTGSTTIGSDSLKGYEAYHTGKDADGNDVDFFEGQKKIDDYTFEFTVDSSFLPYFQEAALASADVFPLHAVSENLVLNEDGTKLVAKDGYEPSEEEIQKYKDDLQKQIDNLNAEFEEYVEEPGEDASEDDKAAYEEEKAAHEEEIKILEDKMNGDIDPSLQLIEQAMLNIYNDYRVNPTVTTGPYMFDEFKNNMVKLSLNPNYAGNAKGDKATVPHIIVQTVNSNIAVDLLENGDIDIWESEADGGKIDQMRAAADAGKIKFNEFERSGYGNLTFLTDRGCTQYKEVRQAIAHLMDRNSFVQSYAGGYGVVTNGMYGQSQWMYKEKGADLESDPNMINYQLNLDTANELLDKTPFTFEADGKTPWDKAKADEEFASNADNFDYFRYDENGKRLVVNQYGSDESPITTLISNQLPNNAKQVGMEYNVTAGNFATLLQYYTSPTEDAEYTAFNMGTNFAPIFDPWYQYNSKGSDNKTRTNDPAVDEITEKLRRIAPDDKEAFLEEWMKFQLWYNDYLPEIPLYSNLFHTGYTNRVEGFDINTPTWQFADQVNAITIAK